MEKTRMLVKEEPEAGVTEGGRSPTEVTPASAAGSAPGDPGSGNRFPDPAVPERPDRRRFTAEYKLRSFRKPIVVRGQANLAPCCVAKACTRRT